MSQQQRIVCRVCRVNIATVRTFFLVTRVIATDQGEIVESDRRESVVRCKRCQRIRTVTL